MSRGRGPRGGPPLPEGVDVDYPLDYMFPVKVLSQDHRDEYLRLVATLFDELRAAADSKRR
jgi:hypothetical protein